MSSLVDLSQESLSKTEIINFCRAAPATDWPPPDRLWKGRSRDLKRGLNLDKVPMGGPRERRHGYVRLTDLWPWVISRPDKPHWEWLVEFCPKWATVLGVELEGTCKDWIAHLAAKYGAEIAAGGKPEEPKRDELKAKALDRFPSLSGLDFSDAWKRAAHPDWKKQGRHPNPIQD